MPGWTLVDNHPTQGRAFQRPLSIAEHVFFLDELINKPTDISRYLELRLLNGDTDLFSDANIMRAWVSTKRRYPLAGAVVQRQRQGWIAAGRRAEEDDRSTMLMEPHFVVRECDLSVLRPREIVFGQVADPAEVQHRVATILNGPRLLSEELLVQLYVFRETGTEEARADIFHMMVLISHCVGDELASRTLVRCFLDTLARGGGPDLEPTQLPLEDRLAMAIPMEDLEPVHLRELGLAKRRWRKAIASVIVQMRFAKRQGGGHTLPRRPIHSTRYTARPGLIETSLTHAQSAAVIAKCRRHKLTFGNAYLPLAQVAMTRVLYRRYLRGEISEEEWEYRKKQPHINDGPMNSRPYLDKTWFEGGGGGEFMLSIGAFAHQLPFMTLGRMDCELIIMKRTSSWSNCVPSFSELLTFERFLYRASLVKKQTAEFLRHPLFLEITQATFLKILEYQRLVTLRASKGVETGDRGRKLDEVEAGAVNGIPWIVSHGGASLGNTDLIFPFEYPLPSTHVLSPYSHVPHPLRAGYATPPSRILDVAPTIAVECERSHLRPYVGELYLGAITWRGQLKMYISYDVNAYEDGIVREWLDEVRQAVLWYLGGIKNAARL